MAAAIILSILVSCLKKWREYLQAHSESNAKTKGGKFALNVPTPSIPEGAGHPEDVGLAQAPAGFLQHPLQAFDDFLEIIQVAHNIASAFQGVIAPFKDSSGF